MIPVFVVLFYCGLLTKWCYLAAAIVFVIAAGTDTLDGYIARSRGLVTNLGKFLDPIADKVLVSTAFIILLTVPSEFSAFTLKPFGDWGLYAAGIMVALILARELIVSGFRMVAAGRNVVLAADRLGKMKTMTQDIAITMLIVSVAFSSTFFGSLVGYGGLAFFAVCTLLTVISGVNYIVRNLDVLKEEKDGTT